MKYRIILLLILSTLFAEAQFKNKRIAEENGSSRPGDPSVIINHHDPNNIIVGAGKDMVISTTDGGITWMESTLVSPLGVAGNAWMIVDAKGRIYDFHLSDSEGKGPDSQGWHDGIVCQRSDDFGKTWTEGSSIGGNSTNKSDKQGVAVNSRKQVLYTTWTQFDQYPSQEPGCQSNIVFSSASNTGNRWDKPLIINKTPGDCSNGKGSAVGATPAIGVGGRIFVTWTNQGVIYFDRSYDDGKTWLTNDLPIAKQEGGWVHHIPGFGTTHNTPMLMIDNSASRYHGMLFLLFADQRSGIEDTDIWLHRSSHSGDSWAPALRVNNDEPGKHQFSPSIAVDQTNGYVYIVYLDRRAYEDMQTDVYLSYSVDGGGTFRDIKISEAPFIPSETGFFEHTAISAHNGVIAPVWSRLEDGKISLWTSIIMHDQLRAVK